MRHRFSALLPYAAVLAVDFCLLPFLAVNTGAAILLMLCVMPLTAFVSAVICGVRSGFQPILPVIALLLFIPTVWIHYNPSAWIYSPVYAAAVLAGNLTGTLFHGKR